MTGALTIAGGRTSVVLDCERKRRLIMTTSPKATAQWRSLCDEDQRLKTAYAFACRAKEGDKRELAVLKLWEDHQARMRAYLTEHGTTQ